MPPLFMDSRSESSVTSFSGEDSHCQTDSEAGGERGGRGETGGREEAGGGKRQKGEQRVKRRERNRDAARKSRMKQTEKADLLHQEFQVLEKAKSTLEKEIQGLKKEHKLYSYALEQHQSCCSLLRPTGTAPAPSSPPAPRPVSALQPSLGAPAPLSTPSSRSAAPQHVLVPLSSFTTTSSAPETPSFHDPTLTTTPPGPGPLLSLLTTPSPLILPPLAPVPALTSGPLPPLSSFAGFEEFAKLLESNEWLLDSAT